MGKAVFEGLVSDEQDRAVDVALVGNEPTYVVLEDGFKYHIDAHAVDKQVLSQMREQIKGNESALGDGMMKMMGKDDLFTKAAVMSAIKHMDKNMAQLFETGIPEQARQYLGMMGFRVVINRHGDVVSVTMPGGAIDET
jgi:hypothetical protein